MQGVDVSAIENQAALALTAFCWWRADIPPGVCETYWRDVHGIMFARIPSLWQARQLRLAANRIDLWPAVQGISFEVAEAAQPHGVGHALFRSEADLATFSGNPLPKDAIPNDARNFISRIGALLSTRGGGRTLIDRINQPAMQGAPPVPAFVLGFVPRAGTVSPEEFHNYLMEQVASLWSRHPDVMRLRVELLPPYSESAMSSPSIPHRWPSDDTYLGWIELAMSDANVAGELMAGLATDELSEKVRAIHTYPVREVYTIVSAGRPTEVGLRGYPAVQLIATVGAHNQRDETLLDLLFGDGVQPVSGQRS